MVAQSEDGFEECRRRQMVSISWEGRARVLSTSMKEERVLMPGGGLEEDEEDDKAEVGLEAEVVVGEGGGVGCPGIGLD